MGYVAIKGGEQAIQGAEALLEYLRCEQGGQGVPLDLDSIRHQLRALHGRVLSEGGLYHPDLAAAAIKQGLGDPLEAAFALRAYRSTQPRVLETPPQDTANMRLIRRISAAFKEIPGGQMLGPTFDYSLRLLRMDLLDESTESFRRVALDWLDGLPDFDGSCSLPKILETLRNEGLAPKPASSGNRPFDITRDPLIFPVPRSAALSTMARADTGSILAIAYSSMRGYGDVHPTVAELRVGYLPVELPHPIGGEPVEIGEILMTECEVVAMYEAEEDPAGGADLEAGSGRNHRKGKPSFTLGYGACFGHNEHKAIAMAILDRALQKGLQHGPEHPSEDQEFVLLHIDGVDSMGFANHYKMPHYVTFQSDLDRLRTTRAKREAEE